MRDTDRPHHFPQPQPPTQPLNVLLYAPPTLVVPQPFPFSLDDLSYTHISPTLPLRQVYQYELL
jgi:hypothetical protein